MFVAIDTETHRFGPGNLAPKIVCLSVSGEPLRAHDDARVRMAELLASDAVLVAHNAAYDFGCMFHNWPELRSAIFAKYDRDQVWCTREGERLLALEQDEKLLKSKRFSLAALSKELFGAEMNKDTWRLHYDRLDGIPIEQWPADAVAYATDDAEYTLQLAQSQEARRRYPATRDEIFRQTRAAFWLRLATVQGVRIDREYVRELKAQWAKRKDAIRDSLLGAGLLTRTKKGVLQRKTKAALARAAIRADVVGFKPRTTPKGKIQLTDKTVARFDSELLSNFVLWGRMAGIETELNKLDVDLIHPEYNALKATGRTSSGGGLSRINIQNRRREEGFREVFVPPPGHVIVAADYEQLELHTLAQVCLGMFGESKLADALNSGEDPHARVAVNLGPAERLKEMRQLAKALNFGLPGGLGETKFLDFAATVYRVVIAESRFSFEPRAGFELLTFKPRSIPVDHVAHRVPADEIREGRVFVGRDVPLYVKAETFGWYRGKWFETYPEVYEYLEAIKRLPKHGGRYTVVQPWSGRVRAGATYCAACNTHFQGLAADGAKLAGWEITKAFHNTRNPLFSGTLLAFVHDEFLVTVPEAQCHEAGQELSRIMVEQMNRVTPDVPNAAAPVAMRRWTKGAEAMFESERLVPWAA